MVTAYRRKSLSIVIAAVALALVSFAPQTETPKWEEILRNIHRDIRTEKGIQEEWDFQGTSKDGETVGLGIKRWMDGPRFRQEVSYEGDLFMAGASDGARYWIAFSGHKCYLWDSPPEDPVKDKWTPPPPPDPGDNTVNVSVSNGYDLVIRLSPAPTITKVEEVDGERRVRATLVSPEQTMNLVLHFEKEKWLLKEMEGNATDGKTKMTFKRTKSLRNQTFESDLWALDAKIVKDLRELTGDEREAFIKASKGGDQPD